MRCARRGGMVAKSVEELLVYQKALAACDEVSALAERSNLCKDFELRQQLNSAAGSIPANIAEGFGQQTDRQFARYLYFARGSSKRTLRAPRRGAGQALSPGFRSKRSFSQVRRNCQDVDRPDQVPSHQRPQISRLTQLQRLLTWTADCACRLSLPTVDY